MGGGPDQLGDGRQMCPVVVAQLSKLFSQHRVGRDHRFVTPQKRTDLPECSQQRMRRGRVPGEQFTAAQTYTCGP